MEEGPRDSLDVDLAWEVDGCGVSSPAVGAG